MAKPRSVWRCQQCGHSAARWLGRCPDCGEFGSFVEEAVAAQATGGSTAVGTARVVTCLADVSISPEMRFTTGIAEFDNVLGGGLVRGSVVLIGGEPGIGKSTLLLQAAGLLGKRGVSVLYVCGEESPQQVRSRADRVGASDGISLLPEVDVSSVEATALAERPQVVIVDSIQALFDPGLDGASGSVGQVRATAARLVRMAKTHEITLIVVGHVTKDGTIAGPRVLEHMVDTVLYFEGDSDHTFRIVRAVKNRFGSVSEIGIFEMGECGLAEVPQPSGVLLAQRVGGVAGSAVMAAMEGSRPLLVEVQALVTPSYGQVPRRLAVGIDTSRVLQVLAILERRADVALGTHDVYVSVAGGVRVTEPAVDLPLALALASAHRERELPHDRLAFGEIGLTGEVRAVPHASARLREASRMGFTCAMGPSKCEAGSTGIEYCGVGSIRSALEDVLG
ncbi:MAG: DNA repair protein RadA [Coriobacteriia bacterium]|nr:DNA repair protein RadA [Coriobacteriia bacterium]